MHDRELNPIASKPPGESENTRDNERNRLLLAIPPDEYERLGSQLESVELSAGQVVWQPNTPIRSIYFPRTCVMSLLTLLDGDGAVEAATIGNEGMAGTPVVLGARVTASRCLAQVAGHAARIDADHFAYWLRTQNGELFPLLLRYVQALHEQTAQSVACNRRHDINERCARWLLMTHDRAGTDQFTLTQEFLAYMLGVRRASVTVAAGALQEAGLIRYRRGKITILDRQRLEEASCECLGAVQRSYRQLLGSSAAQV